MAILNSENPKKDLPQQQSADSIPITFSPSSDTSGPFSSPSSPAPNASFSPAASSGDTTSNTDKQPDFFSSAALQEKAETSKLLKNIASQKNKLEEPKIEDLLGKKSTILETSIEQEAIFKLKRKLRVAQFLALFVTIAVFAVNGFLYYQLSPGINLFGFKYTFEQNLRNDLFSLNENLRSMQTELSTYRFLSGQLYLNQFGYESTRLIDSVARLEESTSTGEKTILTSIINESLNQMPLLLTGAKENLTKPITIDTYPTRGEEESGKDVPTDLIAQKALKKAISDEKNAFIKAEAKSGRPNIAELSFYDNTIKLVGNVRLTELLNSFTVDNFRQQAEDYYNNPDPAQRLAFRSHIDNLLASTKVNLATITNLRNSRIKWSEVIERIETITKQVNAEHNSGKGGEAASIITYSSYGFSSTNPATVSINAFNSTKSGTNREVVTYLMEALEFSPEFKNVKNRTFPLTKTTNKDGEDVYTMSFRIDMELEDSAFSRNNSPIENLQNDKKVAAIKVPVKNH